MILLARSTIAGCMMTYLRECKGDSKSLIMAEVRSPVFIGVCVERTDEGHYRLHQKQYIDQILSRLRLSGVRHAASPERGGTASKLKPQVGPLSIAEAEFMKKNPLQGSCRCPLLLGKVNAMGHIPCVRTGRAIHGEPEPKPLGGGSPDLRLPSPHQGCCLADEVEGHGV